MARLLVSVLSLGLVFICFPRQAQAQGADPDAGVREPSAPPAREPPPAGEGAPPSPSAEEITSEPGAAPTTSPPALAPLTPSLAAPEATELTPPAAQPSPATPPPAPVEKKRWTLPETSLHLHGYFRLRGTLLKNGWLGHSSQTDRLPIGDRTSYDPFSAFRPNDRYSVIDTRGDKQTATSKEPVEGGCGDSYGADGRCDKQTQVSGDLRLRLKPEIHVSDDVRVKAWIDVLDNVGAGTLGYGPDAPSTGNAIRVRRAWGEVRNRDLGELRFGRMGADWGLGILDNGGDRLGIDSDFSSDVDRIMGITNLAGFYLMAAYDWASEGAVQPGSATPSGVPIDTIQSDDLDVITAAVARRAEPEAQESALLRGEAVFNYGVYFVWRDQLLQARKQKNNDTIQPLYSRLDQSQYIPDAWFQFLWEGLRVELEGAFVAGALEGQCPKLVVTNPSGSERAETEATEITAAEPDDRRSGTCKMRQLGVALETEYRLFDERLGLYLFSGFASGDAQSYGLAATNNSSLQRVSDEADRSNSTLSTYAFHPDYRVDLILWRTVMRRVAGAYYVKPGVSYDFIRDPYGQQAGGRLDIIYSRATQAEQTWGNSGNLGLEMDLSLYYRSEDGPDVMDGFYGLVQWGVLFPFKGLEGPNASNMNAMALRGVAGIAF